MTNGDCLRQLNQRYISDRELLYKSVTTGAKLIYMAYRSIRKARPYQNLERLASHL